MEQAQTHGWIALFQTGERMRLRTGQACRIAVATTRWQKRNKTASPGTTPALGRLV